MKDVVGVRFRDNGRIYFFDPKDYILETGDAVIAETVRGLEYGRIVLGRREIDETKMSTELKPIVRKANDTDFKVKEDNKSKNKRAFDICTEKVEKYKLNMHITDAEYTFDGSKLLFYFTSDTRVDFRELVKELASVFKTRIELRQIGVRDEAKMVGGLGVCGRELCCHAFLSDFAPVSIKMAKDQSLSLNPTKISGSCGRLMCCLSHEQNTYEYLNKTLPSVGEDVVTITGVQGEVAFVNVIRQMVKIKVILEDGTKELQEYKIDELKYTPKGKRDSANNDRSGRGTNDDKSDDIVTDEALKKILDENTSDNPDNRSRDNRSNNRNRYNNRNNNRYENGNRNSNKNDNKADNKDGNKDGNSKNDNRNNKPNNNKLNNNKNNINNKNNRSNNNQYGSKNNNSNRNNSGKPVNKFDNQRKEGKYNRDAH